jgi:tetratricopeptide (TPR) repeat protein
LTTRTERFRPLALAVLLAVTALSAPAQENPAIGDAVTEAGSTATRSQAYFHLMKATLAAQQGRVRELLAEIRLATKIDPDSAELRAESASLLLSLGQRVEAEKQARAALKLDPDQPVALRLLGDVAAARALSGRGDEKSRDEAIRLYEKLVAGSDADDDTLGVLARLKFAAGDIDGAIEVSNRLAERRKGDVRLTLRISRMLREAGRDAAALETLLNFLATHGEQEILLPHISELARKTEMWMAVERACARWLEIDPEATALRKLRGEALLQQDDYAGAVAELERVLEEDRLDPLLLFHLTTAYGSLGRLADAAETARSLEVALPGNPSVQAVLGDTLARQGRWREAVDALRAALEGFIAEDAGAARRDVVRRRIALLYLDQERTAEAADVIDDLEQADDSDNIELRFRRAIAESDLGAARKAIGRLRDVDEHGRAALLEGEELVVEGKVGRARAKFKEASSKLGMGVWARVGEIWRANDRAAEGEKALRGWVEDDPENAEAHFSLGGFLEREGRFDDGEASLREALRLDPSHANALNYLGYAMADRNERLEEALVYIRRALEIDPWNGAYLDSLGWVYFRLGRLDEAREPLERAAREYPADATVLEHLGDLYRRLGENEEALTMWRRALDAGAERVDELRSKIEAAESETAAAQVSGDGSGARSSDSENLRHP